ncbi:MAG: DMT family transporter, partial [archaeon]|nr:DMT family transporter [archaeon]
MESKIAVLGLIVAALIWSITGVSYKVFESVGIPLFFTFWVLVIFRFISVWFISDYKGIKHELVTDLKELRMIGLNSLFALGTPVFFILAITNISVPDAYFLVYTAPAWVLILSIFLLGEKISLKKISGLALTLIGIYLIAHPENIFELNIGFLFALAAAFTYSGDIITGRELKDYSFHTVAIYASGFQTIVLTFFVFFYFGIPPLENSLFYLGIIALLGLFRGV